MVYTEYHKNAKTVSGKNYGGGGILGKDARNKGKKVFMIKYTKCILPPLFVTQLNFAPTNILAVV